MSLVDGWLNQKILYKRYTGSSDTGKAEYDQAVEIPCRLQDERRLVRDSAGREVVSEARLFIGFPVSTQDAFVVDEKEVRIIQVAEKVDLDGRFDHCEVSL